MGRHGDISADQARRRAAEMVDRIKRGEDSAPAPSAPEVTVADLAERYMRQHVALHCKASRAEVYRRALDNHILPALGEMPVGAVGLDARSCRALMSWKKSTAPSWLTGR